MNFNIKLVGVNNFYWLINKYKQPLVYMFIVLIIFFDYLLKLRMIIYKQVFKNYDVIP